MHGPRPGDNSKIPPWLRSLVTDQPTWCKIQNAIIINNKSPKLRAGINGILFFRFPLGNILMSAYNLKESLLFSSGVFLKKI